MNGRHGLSPLDAFELVHALGGEANELAAGSEVSGFAWDSRGVAPGDLFLAIQGDRVDGHDFAEEALSRGAVATVAERPVAGPHILVPNLVDALARMALAYRKKYKGPVVGVTGSVGKTTCKELVAAALSPLGPIAKTEGNRNTEYTAPLLWPSLSGTEAAVVVELGMRGFGQIRHLATFAQPTIGVITNVGHTHLELVGSREGIALAKAELFEALPANGLAIAWAGDDFLGTLRAQAPCPLETFGWHSGDAQVEFYRSFSWHEGFAEFRVRGRRAEAKLSAPGKHMALMASAALLVSQECDVPLGDAAWALQNAQMPELRMQVLDRNGVTIVLDAYNAAPSSFRAALETLAELPCAGRRLVVMGEMRELGASAEDAHREVGRMIASSGASQVLFIGELAALARDEALVAGMSYGQTEIATDIEGVRAFIERAMPGDTVLIKGSRALALERAIGEEAEAK